MCYELKSLSRNHGNLVFIHSHYLPKAYQWAETMNWLEIYMTSLWRTWKNFFLFISGNNLNIYRSNELSSFFYLIKFWKTMKMYSWFFHLKANTFFFFILSLPFYIFYWKLNSLPLAIYHHRVHNLYTFCFYLFFSISRTASHIISYIIYDFMREWFHRWKPNEHVWINNILFIYFYFFHNNLFLHSTILSLSHKPLVPYIYFIYIFKLIQYITYNWHTCCWKITLNYKLLSISTKRINK